MKLIFYNNLFNEIWMFLCSLLITNKFSFNFKLETAFSKKLFNVSATFSSFWIISSLSVSFKPLSYCFEEIIAFDVKASFCKSSRVASNKVLLFHSMLAACAVLVPTLYGNRETRLHWEHCIAGWKFYLLR